MITAGERSSHQHRQHPLRNVTETTELLLQARVAAEGPPLGTSDDLARRLRPKALAGLNIGGVMHAAEHPVGAALTAHLLQPVAAFRQQIGQQLRVGSEPDGVAGGEGAGVLRRQAGLQIGVGEVGADAAFVLQAVSRG
jgi:hypothetical protein